MAVLTEQEKREADRYGLPPAEFLELRDDVESLRRIMELRRRLRRTQAKVERFGSSYDEELLARRQLTVELRKLGVMKRTLANDMGVTDMVVTQDEALMAKRARAREAEAAFG